MPEFRPKDRGISALEDRHAEEDIKLKSAEAGKKTHA